MTFTVKIALQPFEVAFEAGSIAEAVAILTEPDNELSKLAALANGTATGDDGDGSEEQGVASPPTAEKPAPAKRSRKPKATPEAVAPPPMPVPDAAPPAPPAPAPVDAGPIPPFLDRTAGAPAATLAPPPAPAPVVAPAPAAPPPVGVLAPKVVAELNRRKEGQPDGGAGLIAWLAGAGLVVPSATWDEAILCVQFLDDAKLGPVAGGLGVA